MPEAASSTVSLKLLIQAVDKASKTVNSIQKQLNEASASAKKFSESSEQASAKGQKGFKKTGEAVTGLTDQIKKAEKATQGFGKVALQLTGLAASIGVPFGLAAKSSADFELSMSKVLAVTDQARENFEELKNVAGELGRTTKFTARQAAEGMTYLGQAGFSAQEVIAGIGPSLTLAVAAAVDLGDAANIASNVLSGMRLPISDLNNVVDVLAKVAAESNAELIDMAQALSYAGPVAASAGVEFEELAALVGVLGNAGIQGTRAGTALRGALFALTAPTDKAKKALKDLGVEIEYGVDGSVDLIQVFHDLADAGLTAADTNQIFGRYASAAVLAINGQIDALDSMVEGTYAAAGAGEEMAEIMKTNLRGSITALLSALDGLKRAFGDQLLTPLTLLVKSFTQLVTWTTELVQKFPVLTKLIGLAAGSVIALSLALAGLALSIAAVNGALGFLSGKVLTRVATGLAGLQIQTTATAVTNLGASFGGLAAILKGAVLGALKGVIGAMKGLIALMIANPITAIITAITVAITALVVAVAEWRNRLNRLISENRKFAAELRALNSSIAKQVDTLNDAEVGSRRYQSTAIKLRKELLRVAENQEELADKATNAANSINNLTGEFNDGGRALRDFQEAAKSLELDTIQEQAGLLSEKLARVTGEGSLLDKVIYNTGITFSQFKATLFGGDLYKPIQEAREEADRLRGSLRGVAGSFIDSLKNYQEIDMSASLEEMRFFFQEIRGLTKEEADIFVERFQEMQEQGQATSESARSVGEITTEKLREDVDQTINKLQDLQRAYEFTVEKSGEAISALSAGTGSEAEAERAYQLRVDANRRLLQEEENLNEELQGLRRFALEDAKDKYDEEIAAIERRNRLGELKEYEYNDLKAQAEEQFARDKKAAIDETLKKAAESGARELDIVKDLTQERKSLDREVERSSAEVRDTRIRHANEVKDAVLDIEQETASILASLGGESGQIDAQRLADLKEVERAAAEIGIQDTEAVARLKAAINKKYAREEVEYRQKILEANQDREIAGAQRRADEVVKSMEEKFKQGEVTPEQYVNVATAAQTEAIDAELEALYQQLEFAQNTLKDQPLVIQIRTEIEGLEGDRATLEAEKAKKISDAKIAAKQRELSIEQKLTQGELANMNLKNSTEEEMIQKKLEIQRLANEQELLQMEQAGVEAVNIAKRRAQQEVAIAEQAKDLRLEARKKELQMYATMASTMGNVFGDLYAASGEEAKEFFYLQKAAKIAQTIMSTQVAAMEAYAQGGPYSGPILAAMIYAQGAAAIAKITAQKLAEGGLVFGSSPNDKADNIPAWLTANEYVHPVDAVKHYGVGVMNALRDKLIPKEVFTGYSIPVQRAPRSSRGYATGGLVSAQKKAEQQGQNMGDNGQREQKQEPIQIVNVVDPSVMEQYIASTSGKNVIFNVLRSNAYELNNILASEM